MNESLVPTISSCLHCLKPRCRAFCPLSNPIPEVLTLLKEGKEEEAANALYASNPFPELSAPLCDHARQCKGHCVRGVQGEPVDFPSCELSLAKAYRRPLEKKGSNGKKAVIVGAGPAGLSAAYFLTQGGYEVEVYEKENGVGGAILTGIPSFRFHKSPLLTIRSDLEAMGVRFHFGVEIGKDLSFADIEKNADEAILALGATKENLAGMSLAPGMESGLSFLYHLNRERGRYIQEYRNQKGEHVIWGGGNVALDSARMAKRMLGKATILYRRSEKEMPASLEEIDAAKKEGVRFAFLENISGVRLDEEGRLKALETVKMELGEPDASGRASCHEMPGSGSLLPCSHLILCLGEKAAIPASFGLDPQSLPDHVHLCGDLAYGAKTIAQGIASGRDLAKQLLLK